MLSTGLVQCGSDLIRHPSGRLCATLVENVVVSAGSGRWFPFGVERATVMPHRPDHACQSIGKRHRCTVVPVAGLEGEHPPPQVMQRRRVDPCPHLHAVECRPLLMNEQRSQVRVPTLGDATKTSSLTAAGFTRCEPSVMMRSAERCKTAMSPAPRPPWRSP